MESTRRKFLGGLGVAIGSAACARTPATTTMATVLAEPNDVLAGDALDQAARIRSGQATPLEMVDATIERIEALDAPINAIVTRFYDRARAEAVRPTGTGPFAGVPFLLKDLNDLVGTPKSMGSHLFDGFVSSETGPQAQAAVDAGLIILGKTNTPEFGLTATGESAALGICRNPWNLDHSAGGSSSGAAAAVAAGMIPMAHASDGGGSIRVPASCCGVFGLKPSRGRNRSGAPSRAVDISIQHCVSRSVRDTAAYSTVVQRTDANAPYAPLDFVEGPSKRRLRIAFYTQNVYGTPAHLDVRSALEETAALCRELGHEVVPVDFDFEGDDFKLHFLNLWTSVPAALLADVRRRGLDPEEVLESVTLGMAERFSHAPPNAISKAVSFFEGYTRRIDAHFDGFDVFLSPVLRRPPIRIGEQGGTQPFADVFGPMIDYVSYTPVFNATGHPAMSVPLGWSSQRLPIGSHFVARHGDERTLLELAYELEAARPWAHRVPAPVV
jgi:amidase